MLKKNSDLEIERIALEPVPPEQKKSWISIAFIWSGNVICIPALMVGSMIATGLPFAQCVLAMVIGYSITCVLMMFIAAQAANTGVPAVAAVTRALGIRGSQVTLSLIFAISMIGWFGYNNIVCAESFCSFMGIFGFNFPQWLACILLGGLMLFTAFHGIGLTKYLNIISVPLLIIVLVAGVVMVLNDGGAEVLRDWQPAEPMPMVTAITISVGGFIAGAVTAGDYNRYSKDSKSAALSAFFGIMPCGIGALVCGGILAICTGQSDISLIFASFGMPVLGLLVLILATWTTNVGNAYSGGIAAMSVFRFKDDKRPLVTAICGIIGILLSLGGIVYFFVDFLSWLSYFITPVCAILITDYWIIGKGDAKSWKPLEGFNWIGIISWLSGTVIIYLCPFFIPEIVGIVCSMIIYVILYKVVKSPKLNPYVSLDLSK